MEKYIKRIIAFILIVSFVMTLYANIPVELEAASSSVTLTNLGEIGNVDYVGKKKTGKWYKIYISGREAFCENLGYTCHTGDVYQSSEATYSNKSGNRIEELKAYLGYWYGEKMNASQKAYIFAQALFWAINEGLGSEADLKAVIKKMKDNTGYYSGTTVNDLYNQIFTGGNEIKTKVVVWKYTGSGNHRQELLEIKSSRVKEPKLKKISNISEYRQRIILRKEDEYGNLIPHVKFKIKAENIDELYDAYSAGYGESEANNTGKSFNNFEPECETNDKGMASFRFTYRVQSEDYYYYDNSVLETMTEDEIKKAKKSLDEEGLKYASNLSRDGALAQMEADLKTQIKKIKNAYRIYEISTGSNKALLISDEYKNGKRIELDGKYTWIKSGDIWPDEYRKDYENYVDSYLENITNKHKKIRLNIKKVDGYSGDKKSHGQTSFEGAVYGIYTDANCKHLANMRKSINSKPDDAIMISTKEGSLESGYLDAGAVYYIKELEAPKGYLLSEKIYKIEEDLDKYSIELNRDEKNYELEENPILGEIAIQKYSTDGDTGFINEEKNASFQIYLKEKGAYEKCDDYERDTIVTNEKGYAKSKQLYYGTYIVHQLSTGDNDSEKVKDFEVEISEARSGPYYYVVNNKPFSAYLKIVKKDKNTGKTVLKEGTSYEIYSLDENNKESKVVQKIISQNGEKEISEFVTDQSGIIMTPNRLPFGKYRIYEKSSAKGLHIVDKYIDIEISSEKNNYISKTDENGNTYSIVEVEYINEETYGRLKIEKRGKSLSKFENGEFIYEDVSLQGAKLQLYAKEDIETRDGQGDLWFEKDQLVCEITSGQGVVFTKECGGICKYYLEGEHINIDLPLGKYYIKEVKAPFGHIKSEKTVNLSFEWEDSFKEFVLNSEEKSEQNEKSEKSIEEKEDEEKEDEEDQILKIENEYAQTVINIEKRDKDTKKPIKGAVFELYSKDDIYNGAGEKISQANDYIACAETDENGDACFYMPLPIKDSQNTGDYYLIEKKVGRGYYLDSEKHFVHLEYQDDNTPVIYKNLEIENQETKTFISKKSLTSNKEIKGCSMEIRDSKDNLIVSWISGDEKSISLNKELDILAYQNIEKSMDSEGNLRISGLFIGEEYKLIEKKPAKGYVTAETIKFVLDSTNKTEKKVEMKDDITKIEFQKKSILKQLIGNVKIVVLDDSGKEVLNFVTKDGMPTQINGIFQVGKTYTFMELYAPKPFAITEPIKYTILDTGNIQKITMIDDYLKKAKKTKQKKNDSRKIIDDDVPKGRAPSHDGAPETGDYINLNIILFMLIMGMCGSIFIFVRRRK